MFNRRSIRFASTVVAIVMSIAAGVTRAAEPTPSADSSGIVRVKSAYPMNETIASLKQDVAAKGIRFFLEVDQSKLAAEAGISVRPSTLLVFGNPPLGTLFVRANPLAGLDWPVRLLVLQDERGDVWAAYTDFAHIARRHRIQGADREAFAKASMVIASIASSVQAHEAREFNRPWAPARVSNTRVPRPLLQASRENPRSATARCVKRR
jgi:uncharacterized protein (DUF302 family)